MGSSRDIRRTRRKDNRDIGKTSRASSPPNPETVSLSTIVWIISRPRRRSESWLYCWIEREHTAPKRCRRTCRRRSGTSQDSRPGSYSGPPQTAVESGRPLGGKSRHRNIPLLRGTFRPATSRRSRPHAFELHIPHAEPDFAEEDLLFDPVCESDGSADFRPRPAVALRHHMDEVLRVMGLRVAFVCPEVGAVLETGLRDHPTARQVLVRLEAQLEVGLDRLRLFDEPRQADRTVRVRVSHLDETSFQKVRRLEEAELQPPADDLPEEPGFVKRLRLDLVNHDRPIAEEMHDDVGLPDGRRPVAARMRLADAVVRQIALFVPEAEQE